MELGLDHLQYLRLRRLDLTVFQQKTIELLLVHPYDLLQWSRAFSSPNERKEIGKASSEGIDHLICAAVWIDCKDHFSAAFYETIVYTFTFPANDPGQSKMYPYSIPSIVDIMSLISSKPCGNFLMKSGIDVYQVSHSVVSAKLQRLNMMNISFSRSSNNYICSIQSVIFFLIIYILVWITLSRCICNPIRWRFRDCYSRIRVCVIKIPWLASPIQ